MAFHFHLKYHDIVTARRVHAVVFVIWLSGLCLALAWLWDAVTYDTIVFVNVPLHFVVTTSAYIEDYADEMAIRYETKHKPTLTNRQEAHWTWQSTGGLYRAGFMEFSSYATCHTFALSPLDTL